ncbi:Pre-mRNA-splicing factor 38A [Nibea albiflora]|nr:Pre-mRNA-splicing factor 38A [Nibea albiflora]
MYMRLTGTAVDCYKYLEPLYNDYRKIKTQNRNGEFELMHVDEFIDELLHSERMCDIILPRLQAEMLDPRISALEEDLDEVESSEDEDEEEEKPERLQTPEPHRRSYRDNDRPRRSPSPRYRRSRSPRRFVFNLLAEPISKEAKVRSLPVSDMNSKLLNISAAHARSCLLARRHGESAIAARAPGDIAAGPEKDGTAPNLQVTTEATDIAATPSLRRGE